jgi:hypothetical protein
MNPEEMLALLRLLARLSIGIEKLEALLAAKEEPDGDHDNIP